MRWPLCSGCRVLEVRYRTARVGNSKDGRPACTSVLINFCETGFIHFHKNAARLGVRRSGYVRAGKLRRYLMLLGLLKILRAVNISY